MITSSIDVNVSKKDLCTNLCLRIIQESNHIFNNSTKTSFVKDKSESDTNIAYLLSSSHHPPCISWYALAIPNSNTKKDTDSSVFSIPFPQSENFKIDFQITHCANWLVYDDILTQRGVIYSFPRRKTKSFLVTLPRNLLRAPIITKGNHRQESLISLLQHLFRSKGANLLNDIAPYSREWPLNSPITIHISQ